MWQVLQTWWLKVSATFNGGRMTRFAHVQFGLRGPIDDGQAPSCLYPLVSTIYSPDLLFMFSLGGFHEASGVHQSWKKSKYVGTLTFVRRKMSSKLG